MAKDKLGVGEQWEFVTTKMEKRPLGTDEPSPHHVIISDFGGKQKNQSYELRKKSDITTELLSVAKPSVDVEYDLSSLGDVLDGELPDEAAKTQVTFEKMGDFSRDGLRGQLEASDPHVRELLETLNRLEELQKLIKIPQLRAEFDKLIDNAGSQGGERFQSLQEFLEVFDNLPDEEKEGMPGVGGLRSKMERALEK